MAKSTKRKSARRNPLRTQKDGRLYAIALLENVDAQATSDERFSAERGSREGPQDDMIFRAFERVMYFAKGPAILGFFCVMTDKIGISSHTPGSSYRHRERRGKLQFWRLPRHDASVETAEAAHA